MIETLIIFLPSFVFCLMLILYQIRNNKIIGSITFLIFLYFLIALLGGMAHISGVYRSVLPIQLEPILYFTITILLVLLSFTGFKDKQFKGIFIENLTLFRFCGDILIIGGFFSIIFYFPFAVNSLQGDVKMNRIDGINQSTMANFGWINSLATLFSNLFVIMLLFAFLELCVRERPRMHRVLLLVIASSSFILNILAFVGRDGFIYWVLSAIFMILLMKDFISQKALVNIKRLFFIIGALASIPFIVITFARFGKNLNLFFSNVLSYGGMQIANFNDKYQINAPIRHGFANFERFMNFLLDIGVRFKAIPSKELIQWQFSQKNAVTWVFSTFIGSLFSDFGKFGSFFFVFMLFMIGRILIYRMRLTGYFSLSRLIVFVLYYQFVSWGIFYNRMADLERYALFVLFLSFVLFASKSKNNLRINSKHGNFKKRNIMA